MYDDSTFPRLIFSVSVKDLSNIAKLSLNWFIVFMSCNRGKCANVSMGKCSVIKALIGKVFVGLVLKSWLYGMQTRPYSVSKSLEPIWLVRLYGHRACLHALVYAQLIVREFASLTCTLPFRSLPRSRPSPRWHVRLVANDHPKPRTLCR